MIAPAFPPVRDAVDMVGRRSAARLRLSIPARFISLDGYSDCILIDLSETGAQIALAQPLRRGAAVYLQVARFEIFAEAVRRVQGPRGGVNGLVFDERISPETVLAVRAHAETLQQREQQALRDQVRRWVTGEG
jgi:hypothetical protein